MSLYRVRRVLVDTYYVEGKTLTAGEAIDLASHVMASEFETGYPVVTQTEEGAERWTVQPWPEEAPRV